jgi:hypothetical protein
MYISVYALVAHISHALRSVPKRNWVTDLCNYLLQGGWFWLSLLQDKSVYQQVELYTGAKKGRPKQRKLTSFTLTYPRPTSSVDEPK